mmetsp:Transcript_6331/g.9234  ORF Transcript_6331/g.9234 Transcript_6331/m.9234 type:complete len:158 (+) Transcript_6331:201-674(+)
MFSSTLKTTLKRKGFVIGGGAFTFGGTLLLQYDTDNEYKKLVKPTAEATIRAGRLAYIGSLMAIDYGRLKRSGMSTRELQLEAEVELNAKKLEIAQAEYTSKHKVDEQTAQLRRESVRSCAEKLAKAEEQLSAIGGKRSLVHARAANRLLELCRANG